jgi:hypothetical protein
MENPDCIADPHVGNHAHVPDRLLFPVGDGVLTDRGLQVIPQRGVVPDLLERERSLQLLLHGLDSSRDPLSGEALGLLNGY